MVESDITWAIGNNDTTCSNINKMIDIDVQVPTKVLQGYYFG